MREVAISKISSQQTALILNYNSMKNLNHKTDGI